MHVVSLFLFHVALILHSNVDLTCFPLLTNLLKGLVILWRVMKKNMILITPFYFLYTRAPVLFHSSVC